MLIQAQRLTVSPTPKQNRGVFQTQTYLKVLPEINYTANISNRNNINFKPTSVNRPKKYTRCRY